jgi:hypothetical protein
MKEKIYTEIKAVKPYQELRWLGQKHLAEGTVSQKHLTI